MKKTNLLFITIVYFLGACSVIQKAEDKSIELKNWQILGPFKPDSQDNYLQFNNLEKWGYTEEQIDFTSFSKIKPDSGITNSAYNNDLNVIDFCKHFGFDPFNDNISGNAYAACTFYVKDTSNYYINFSSDDGGKVYLNNEEIINLEKADLVAKYEVYKAVKLKKGQNFILVKVNNGLYNWQAFVKLEKFNDEGLKEHNNLMSRLNYNKFFTLSLFDTTNILVPSQSLPDSRLKIEIFSEKDSLVQSSEIYKNMVHYPDISELPEGLYYAKLFLGDRELTQDIFKGDLVAAISNCIRQIDILNITDMGLKATIDANKFRFNHLLKPSSRGENSSQKHEWQRKLIYLYKTFREIEKNVRVNKPLQGIPHTALQSFVSNIDNQSQYYISHAPRSYNPEIKYPVVIFAPYFLATQRPYLESMRVADIVIQENLQYFADRYKIIVIEPFCREVSWYNLNSIGETDLFEALNSAKQNYNIDTTRIFLAGSCAGADKALQFAVKFPHLFAGMGLASPAFSTNRSNQEWHQKNFPFQYIENIKEMPVLVMHSVNDRHTSINNSLYFEQVAKENQFQNFTFIKTENDVEEYFWYKYSEKIFEFFSEIQPKEKTDNSIFKTGDLKYNTNRVITILEREKQDFSRVSLNTKNNKIQLETSNVLNFKINLSRLSVDKNKPVSVYENGQLLYKGTIPENLFFNKNPEPDLNQLTKNNQIHGPFTEIFTDRFIVVIGSRGTAEEVQKNESIARFFNEAWNHKYFNDCMVKYDYQTDDSDFKTANLLLVGNFDSNIILKQLEGKIPLEITKNRIKIGNHTETGNDLNVYMLYPNPENTDKYIGIFSGNINDNIFSMMDLGENEFKNLLRLYGVDSIFIDVSCFGWYDYKIWDTKGNTLYSGYFNDYWEK